jgi:hypothetical protein
MEISTEFGYLCRIVDDSRVSLPLHPRFWGFPGKI